MRLHHADGAVKAPLVLVFAAALGCTPPPRVQVLPHDVLWSFYLWDGQTGTCQQVTAYTDGSEAALVPLVRCLRYDEDISRREAL